MPGEISKIEKHDLFARLAEGLAAGISVVTPNRRLAQVLKAEFDGFQAAKGLKVWEDADILPFGALLQRLYEDALYADTAKDLPQLLTPAQERRLWESVLKGAELLSVADTAADCAAAWKLAHAWRIEGALQKFQGNEDTAAFARWADAYERRCKKEGFIDAARLPGLDLKFKKVIAYGFDILPPQVKDFLGADVLECRPAGKISKNLKVSFPSSRHELADRKSVV